MTDKRFRVQKLPVHKLYAQHPQILPTKPTHTQQTRRLFSALLVSFAVNSLDK